MRNGTFLEVDLSQLSSNIEQLKKLCPNNEIIFMVKANGYGHGIVEMVKQAYQSDVKHFGVATLAEAKYLLKKFPQKDIVVYVFSDNNFESQEHLAEYNQKIIPILHQLGQVKSFIDNKMSNKTKLCIKINSGMNRLGIDEEDWPQCIELIKAAKLDVHHLLSHFASSYILLKPHDRTQYQIDKFKLAISQFEAAQIQIEHKSMANSGAIEQGLCLDFKFIRPGLMLYGPQSVQGSPWQVRELSSLNTYILKKTFVKKGTPIGYGGHIAHADGELIFLPLGYGDGLSTMYKGKSFIHPEFGELRFLGRVNMDISCLYSPNSLPLNTGSAFRLWSHEYNSLNTLSSSLGVIPYELTCALSIRIPRKYILS